MGAWLSSIGGWFGTWMFNPWVLLGGAILVASPLLIHLLNRQRFQIIDWAAMDFLLEAEKRNRYRVILEDIILLLLRCLAVLLLGLLLARPFLPTGLTAGLLETASYERIILIDNSLSMTARSGTRTAITDAQRHVTDLIGSLARNDTDDSITLLITSQPSQPLLRGERIDDDTVDDLVRQVENIEASDAPAPLDAALLALEKTVAVRQGELNRVVYIVTDLRQRDWETAPAGASEEDTADSQGALAATLDRLSRQANGCYIVDVGSGQTSNLAIAGFDAEEKALVAGVPARLNVTVRNHGPQDAGNVEVRLTAGESVPLIERVDTIRSQQEATVTFNYTFRKAPLDSDSQLPPVPLRAEVVTGREGCEDFLSADDTRYFAARVVRGLPVLVVDGDPSAVFGRRESFFLARALAPPGDALSGIALDIVTENEFESLPLENYQVVFLANLYRLTAEQCQKLEKWVRAGGGLAIALGDQIDEQLYNETLYAGGKGLLPAQLIGIRGDESERRWVHLRVDQAQHPVMRVFDGENNPFLDAVLVFRWWQVELSGGEEIATQTAIAGQQGVSIPARYTDAEGSPALVEQALGDGRVVLITTPVDGDWTNWPADPSYVVSMQQLARYLAPPTSAAGNLSAGAPIAYPVDLTRYQREAVIRLPDESTQPVQAEPGDQQESSTLWGIEFSGAVQRGFYRLELTPKLADETEPVLFAANIAPDEGDLRQADVQQLKRQFKDVPVQFVSGSASLSLEAVGAKWEIWPWIVGALLGVLALEQVLGWAFGRNR